MFFGYGLKSMLFRASSVSIWGSIYMSSEFILMSLDAVSLTCFHLTFSVAIAHLTSNCNFLLELDVFSVPTRISLFFVWMPVSFFVFSCYTCASCSMLRYLESSYGIVLMFSLAFNEVISSLLELFSISSDILSS